MRIPKIFSDVGVCIEFIESMRLFIESMRLLGIYLMCMIWNSIMQSLPNKPRVCDICIY